MKIVKTTEKEACRSLVKTNSQSNDKDMTEAISFFEKIAAFFSENKKRAIVIACSVLLIGAAITLNWILFGGLDNNSGDLPTGAVTEQPEGDNVVSNPTASEDTYFALAVIERQRARDEAIEVLQTVIDSEDADQNEKNEALSAMSAIANDIKWESNIETLILSAGFTDCIAVIDNGKANIVVETDTTLAANQIAQITGIVYSQTGIEPVNITIRERMPV
jgi:stage III sporulation protein AH